MILCLQADAGTAVDGLHMHTYSTGLKLVNAITRPPFNPSLRYYRPNTFLLHVESVTVHCY